jgi:stage III sporulation protein AG
MGQESSSKSTSSKILSLWRDLFQPEGGEHKNKKKLFLLLILLLGIVLMFAGPFLAAPQKEMIKEEIMVQPRDNLFDTDLARALERILEHIDGISDVQVFINYAGSKEGVYARSHDESIRNTLEMDREGGTREIEEINRREDQVLLRDGGGGEEALLLKEIMPEIKGVLVVARGAENSYLRLEVVRAIQSVLNLPVHRIAFLPYGS